MSSRKGSLRTISREGDPASEILGVIDEIQPMMIVMGTHGRRGFERLVLGSEAEYVLRRSPVPVLTVRAAVNDVGPIPPGLPTGATR